VFSNQIKKSNRLLLSPRSHYQEAEEFKQITKAIHIELDKLFSNLSKISNKEKQWGITRKRITYSEPIITVTADRNLIAESDDESDYISTNIEASRRLHIKISKNYPYDSTDYSQPDLFYEQLKTLLLKNEYDGKLIFEPKIFNHSIIELPYAEHEKFFKKIEVINLEVKKFNEEKLDSLLKKFQSNDESLNEISENFLILKNIIHLPITKYNDFSKRPEYYFDNLKTKEKEKKSIPSKKTNLPVITFATYFFICAIFVWKFMNYFDQFYSNVYFHWTGIGLPLLTGFFFLASLGLTLSELNEEWKKINILEKLSSMMNIIGFYLGACGCVMLSLKLFNPSFFDCVQAHASLFLMSSMICLAIGHMYPISRSIRKRKKPDYKKALLFFAIGIGSLGLCDPNAFKALTHWPLPHLDIHSSIIQILPMVGILGAILLILKKIYSCCCLPEKKQNKSSESKIDYSQNLMQQQ